MKKNLPVILAIIVGTMLVGIAVKSRQNYVSYNGFLTLDGDGLASRPFQEDAEYHIQTDDKYSWTALPITVTGKLYSDTVIEDAHVSPMDISNITDEELTAYVNFIQMGFQEQFEDLWSEVYNKVNGVEEFSSIDATPVSNILSEVHGNTMYGDLQDIMTDALVLLKEINESGVADDTNERARTIYTRYMVWLEKISVEHL